MQQLTEKEAEDFLEKNKFKVVKRSIAKNTKEINKIKIPFPWVMKISSKKIMHKAKIGGVILNIDSYQKAKDSFEKLSKIKNFEEVIIQEMILGAEMVVGIKKTPEFGHVLMFGKGGSKLEQEKDISFRIVPLKEKDMYEIFNETGFFSLIKDKINLEELIKTIKKVQNLIKKYPNIIEFDINPLIINKKTAITVDARLVLN
jgi:hypothetical protein